MPDLPAIKLAKNSSALLPTGEITPSPVIATLRNCADAKSANRR
jgi:hypothetical protein